MHTLGGDGFAKLTRDDALGSSDDYQIHKIANAAGRNLRLAVELERRAQLVGDVIGDWISGRQGSRLR